MLGPGVECRAGLSLVLVSLLIFCVPRGNKKMGGQSNGGCLVSTIVGNETHFFLFSGGMASERNMDFSRKKGRARAEKKRQDSRMN